MENVSDLLLSDDQCFLLHLIMGTYFAPDLKKERPYKSALQRQAEDLPEYHVYDLAVSRMETKTIESIYYYVLRKAEKGVVVKQPLLLQYVQERLPISYFSYIQFFDLFPPNLHKRSRLGSQHCIIDGIIFLNSPATDFLEPEAIERFKRLTGLEDFLLDRKSAMHTFVDNMVLYNVNMQETSALENPSKIKYVNHASVEGKDDGGTDTSSCIIPFLGSPSNGSSISAQTSEKASCSGEDFNPGMLFLPSCPSTEEWSNLVDTIKHGFALTGNAARGCMGPVLGLMDIGESEDSYLFRVSLPGVRRDEKHFRCEVENDGTVIIEGVTVTGERTIQRYSQEFEMQSKNLSPPGPFSITFTLPGPVDPHQFHGTFSTDGIFEGIAFKASRYRT